MFNVFVFIDHGYLSGSLTIWYFFSFCCVTVQWN